MTDNDHNIVLEEVSAEVSGAEITIDSSAAPLEDSGSVCSKYFDCGIHFARKKGKSHINSGKVCQDYCLAKELEGKFSIVVVADGHGGDAYTKSDIGAKMACEVLCELAADVARQFSSSEELDKKLAALISTREFKAKYASMWREKVVQDYREHENTSGLDEDRIVDKYGTTVLFAIITKENYILGQLGDGAILMFNDKGQSQFFCRIRKISSLTRSLASSNAKFAFVTGTFSRNMFNRILLSTDGIRDVFSRKSYFLLYGQGLVQQVQQHEELLRPFNVVEPFRNEDIDLSDETLDDCTVALVLSGIPSKEYSLTVPKGFFPENVSFSRVVNAAEFYETTIDSTYYDIHVLSDAHLLFSKRAFLSCEVIYPVEAGKLKLDSGRSMFIYKRPSGFVSIQNLIDRSEHIEKKYDSGNPDDANPSIYTNNFWLNIYERMLLMNHEISSSGLDLQTFYPEVMFISDNKILITSDALKAKKRDTSTQSPLKKCLDYFNIIGKISFGLSTLPIFGCAKKGQPININAKPLCRVVYDDTRKSFGLWNISEFTWYVEGDNAKEITKGQILPLVEESLSFTADNRRYTLNMYQTSQR